MKLGMTALVGGVCVALLIALAPMKVVKSNFGRALTWRGRIERYVGSPVFEPIDKAFGFERSAAAFDSKTGKGADNYQANMALAAVSTGGIGGRGPGNSYLKNFLPEAESDFIFSIILEEYGLWGCLLILSAYVTILARARIVASRSRYPFHIYTIVGIAILLSIQALMNMMVGVGLMPVTGQTLPMVSMGGTSNFTTGFAYGIMLSISSTTYANMKKDKQTGKNNR